MKKFIILFVVAFVAFLVLVSASAFAITIADCNNGGRYEDMGDGTVQDCRTGLIWLQNAKCTDTSNDIANPTGALIWLDAIEWVKGLGDGLCGLTDGSSAGDWRLPTKTEWMAMVAYGRKMGYTPTVTNAAGNGPWTDGDAFGNMQSGYYSSTMGSCPCWDLKGVVVIDTYDGWVGASCCCLSPCPSVPIYVWPVRGGQSGEFGSVIIQ